MKRPRIGLAPRLALAVGVSATASLAAPMSETEILGGAAARIEKHRKGDVTLLVTGVDGKPAANVDVRIEQTRHAFLFGCNIFMLGRFAKPAENAAYEKHFAELLNFATLPFYWWAYEAEPGRPDYARTEAIAAWCRAHGVRMKGHPLVWNYVDPKWLPADPEAIRRLQLDRVAACVQRFRGQIDCWDVVNEITQFDREMLRRQAPRLTAAIEEAGRMEFVCRAFETARKANPNATLLINDYVHDASYADKVIAKLLGADGKRLYDVIGIQSHQHGGAIPVVKLWEICERFARFGVPLHFTENTLVSGEQGWELADRRKGFDWVSTPEGEARQAKDVERFYTVLFSHPAVQAITWWDFSDQGAWQRAPAGLLRRDMTPKPAYETLHKLIRGDWWTRAAVTTGPDGRATLRGFFGEYRAVFSIDGRECRRSFVIRPDATEPVELTANE